MNEIKQKVLEDVDPEIHRLKKKERRKYRALVTVEFAALIAGIMIVFYILTGISTVQGNSMYPTLHSGDRVIYNRRTADYKAGDVKYPVTVQDDQVFVLGDNREVSEDSRMFGAVSLDDVKGKIVWYMGKL